MTKYIFNGGASSVENNQKKVFSEKL